MRSIDLFSSAIGGVTRNVPRSMLTILGIVIGVAAVILMSAVGESMEGVILGQISSLGPRSMIIFPGSDEGAPGGILAGFDSLTFEDLNRLEKLPSIEKLAPVIFVLGTVLYGQEEASPQVFGVTPEFFENQSIRAARGRLLTSEDEKGSVAVAVIGPDAAEKIFGLRDPVGQRIRIGRKHYTVVGLAAALGSQFFQNADDRVYVPFSVAGAVTGQRYLNYITLQTTEDFDLAFADIRDLLRRRHGIINPENDQKKDDFIVHSSEEANRILGSVSLGLTFFITTVAAISLLVGGIGIMNIMLVTVTERTQEIGLRKAIGARGRDILLQFLLESVLLTLLGGLLGLLLGISSAFLIAAVVMKILSTYAFAIEPLSMIAALLMAALTGLIFGIAPARRAAALHPIEALRYE